MTNQALKFYKFNNHTTSADSIATAKGVEGALVYIVDLKEIWIGGETPKLAVAGSTDVSFSSNVLTVTTHNENGTSTTQTLDFNDVASAAETFKVFQNVYGLIGSTPSGTQQALDYSSTEYLKTATTLVAADKALDTAIKGVADRIDGLDVTEYAQAEVDTATSQTETTVKIKSIKQVDGAISAGDSTVDVKMDGTYDATSNKIATQSTVTNAVTKAADSPADYDTSSTEVSQQWTNVITANEIRQNDTFESDIDKLDNKIAGLADEVIKNEQVTNQAVTDIANSVGLEEDLTLDLSGDTSGIIDDDKSVKEALLDLATYVTTEAGKVDDVKINGTTIVANKIANIAADGTYDATTNKIATKSTVTNAIEALDVNEYAQASVDVDTANHVSSLKIKGIKETDGKIAAATTAPTFDVAIDGEYSATDNKIATQSTVTNAINTLDGSATIASVSNNVVTIKTGVTETDGVITNDSGTDITLEEVAVTGAAADVSIVDAQGKITATNVEDALTELATNIENLAGGMRYNGDINSTTAGLNPNTNDIRPGDIYLANGAFTIGDHSVEAGDMIVYKGNESETAVTLTDSNCTIIERETDTMVTAGDTLADDYIVFGNGNKEVTTTSTVASQNYTVSAAALKEAIENANSALQSIAKGTDGTYVTTTVGAKTNNQQTVAVEVQQATVTYDAASGSTPANLRVATGNEGVLTDTAVTPIKNYVGAKVTKLTDSPAVYDITADEISEEWINVVEANKIEAGDTFDADIDKLDTKIAGLADEVIRDEEVTHQSFTAMANSVGLESDMSLDLSTASQTGAIHNDTDVKSALIHLDNAIQTNKLDVQVEGHSIVSNNTANFGVADSYDSSTNKIATVATVTNAINGLDADITSDDAAVATVKVVETNGKITDVVVSNVSAGVNYTPSTASTAPGLAATTATGAVTGSDIDTIKSYVDDKANLCWEAYE